MNDKSEFYQIDRFDNFHAKFQFYAFIFTEYRLC